MRDHFCQPIPVTTWVGNGSRTHPRISIGTAKGIFLHEEDFRIKREARKLIPNGALCRRGLDPNELDATHVSWNASSN